MRNLQDDPRNNAIVQYAAWAPLTAFTATLVTVWWLIGSRLSTFALDHPNRRSLHGTPVPRVGGVGLHFGVLLSWALVPSSLPRELWVGYTLLLLVSFVDDLHGLPVIVRLVVHLFAASILAAGLLVADFGIPIVLIAVIAISWMTNLYNFMDGSDGLAGGMAVLGFSVYGIAAWLSGSTGFAMLNFTIAAAAAAFLVFNLNPARVFLGDTGSVPLGFLAAAFGLIGWLRLNWALWFPLLVFSPFIIDASATLVRRVFMRERVWEAHRDHYYQRLVRLGWGHRKTAWSEYALMAACGLAALAARSTAPWMQVLVLVAAGLAYIFLIGLIELAWNRSVENR